MEIEINGKNFTVNPHQSIVENKKGKPYKDMSDLAITRDEEKCIGCGICRTACLENNGLGIPVQTEVEGCLYFRPDGKMDFKDSKCTRCGQCILACPTGCLAEKEDIEPVKSAISDESKIVIAQIAPSLRVSLGDSFGKEPDEILEGQMISALKKLGFKYVFDVNLGADFTTYEEAYDLKERIENNKTPMFTSCCPSRVKFIEDFHPELMESLTTVRSPQECLAVVTKTYFAQKLNLDPKNIVVVSIMPCIAKKFESRRSGEDASGQWDVDFVLTTREFIKMVKAANIDLPNLESEKFDAPLGEASGAGAIYGASGGVMESAVRTLASLYNQDLDKIEYEEFRGMEGIKKATLNIDGKQIKIAVTAGLKNAEKIIEEIENGEVYHYIEVMACPGGCVGGGGQPKPATKETINKRREALYKIDAGKIIRKAHENPIIKEVYDNLFKCPGGEIAKKYLHVDYDKTPTRECEISNDAK
ncbi:TPA: 4Fe-4S dicluster domain-containing protein [Candidatus Berkelbacteria bacterium]|uniref:Hydrogenase, Fe-only, NADH-quinone oxidoreductase subunit G n=1 Tax=Berkelbacteria bacterium GW2011_GWE1_39_12 TaxID=1618337 RepID=A0A0G4B3I2_9BACT|nr:MAG: hydrogenase, Fe-only, NADH-quinone oxidoreductase subunit G [Berkelbacteria bacterium GW2011_GWE1_39_12]HBO60628.1 4Fe-4S dicluster domain-containing protein [Candidatus Berkelbacteria bacterium]